jgi:hypothetical protein
MHAFKRELVQELRAWKLIDELHHIHRELVRLLGLVAGSPKTTEWTGLLSRQQQEDRHIEQSLVELSRMMGRKPTVCTCPKAVELLGDMLLAYRTLSRKHASGGLVIRTLRSLRSYVIGLWSELLPILPTAAKEKALLLVEDMRERDNELLDELPDMERSQLSTGGHLSLKP